MAEAKRCDRCNEFYSINDKNEKRGEYHPITSSFKKPVGSMTLYDNNVNRIEHLDLCPKCSRSLIVWLNDWGQYEETEKEEKPEVKEIDVRDNHVCKTCKFHSTHVFERPCSICNNYDMYSAQVAIAKAEDALNIAEVKDCYKCKYHGIPEDDIYCGECDEDYSNFEPKEDSE